jgi:hypothetical protein
MEIELQLTPEIYKAISMGHKACGNLEWAGYIFYKPIATGTKVILEAFDILFLLVGEAGTFNIEEEHVSDPFVTKTRMRHLLADEQVRFGLIHTHHTMGAFFSGTDTDELLKSAEQFSEFLSVVVNMGGSVEAKMSVMSKPSAVELFGLSAQTKTSPIIIPVTVDYTGDPHWDRIKALMQKRTEEKAKAVVAYAKKPAEDTWKSHMERVQESKNGLPSLFKDNDRFGNPRPIQKWAKKEPTIDDIGNAISKQAAHSARAIVNETSNNKSFKNSFTMFVKWLVSVPEEKKQIGVSVRNSAEIIMADFESIMTDVMQLLQKPHSVELDDYADYDVMDYMDEVSIALSDRVSATGALLSDLDEERIQAFMDVLSDIILSVPEDETV